MINKIRISKTESMIEGLTIDSFANDIMNKKGGIKNDDTSIKQISKEQKAEMRKLVKEIKEGKINITGE